MIYRSENLMGTSDPDPEPRHEGLTLPSPKRAGIQRLTGTGIKLKVTEKDTGKEVNYGVQLNNTTLEIEALPNLIVEVKLD